MNTSRRKRAFTLLEILVVIAVVSLLAALLLSVFSRVREQGRITQCKSNLHQIGLAMQQYADDNGTFPFWLTEKPPAIGDPPYGNGPGWAYRIRPYLGSLQTLRCPPAIEVMGVKEDVTEEDGLEQSIGVRYTDYQLNINLSGLPQGLVRRPANLVAIREGGFTDFTNSSTYTDGGPVSGPRHFDQSNHLFVDGHVKLLHQSIVSRGCEGPVYRPNATYSFCN